MGLNNATKLVNQSVRNRSAMLMASAAGIVVASMSFTVAGQVRLAPPSDSASAAVRSSTDARELIRQAIASVGVVLVRNGGPGSGQQLWPRGSAVIIRKDGIVGTNLHVLTQDGSSRPFDELYFVLPDEAHPSWLSQTRYPLKVVAVSRKYDLALLAIVQGDGSSSPPRPRQFPAIQLGDSRHTEILDSITVIGYPETGGTTVTANLGVVEGTDPMGEWIKTDARLVHGNSGGAVVDDDGRLIGIPTKVVLDEDGGRTYGAVGFLRPSYLLTAMLKGLESGSDTVYGADVQSQTATNNVSTNSNANGSSPTHGAGGGVSEADMFEVRGVVRSVNDGKPVAGVRVGLIRQGSAAVTEDSLLTWGGTNSEGFFAMNRKVPKGRYVLKARAIGYEPLTREVRVDSVVDNLVLELQPAP